MSLEDDIKSTPEGFRAWHAERAVLEVTEAICGIMAESGVSRSELAKTLGVTTRTIDRRLDGEGLSIRSASDMLTALGCEFHMSAGPVGGESDTIEARVGAFLYCRGHTACVNSYDIGACFRLSESGKISEHILISVHGVAHRGSAPHDGETGVRFATGSGIDLRDLSVSNFDETAAIEGGDCIAFSAIMRRAVDQRTHDA